MKKKVTKITSILVIVSMIATMLLSLAGCGEEEVVEEDVTTTISVTSEELAPEITDEDLGITRKEPEELSKIVGYQSWEGYDFLVLRNEGGNGSIDTTVQVEDKELFQSLYDARLHIYVDVSYESVSPDDSMYASYAKGLRSLGNSFYELASKETESVPIEGETVAETDENKDDSEDIASDETEEELDSVSEDTENEADDSDLDELLDLEEDSSENDAEEESNDNEESDENAVREDLVDLPKEVSDIETANAEAKASEAALQSAIEAYMQSVSLKRATQILVFALDGELLGEMTPAKLNDYVAAFPINPIPYETENGNTYISDFEDAVDYEVPGILISESGEYNYTIKNDSRRPVIISIYSDTGSKDEYIFANYMATAKSTGWYLVENEYELTSTDDKYRIRVEHKNSDTDLAAYLPEGKVLYIEEISKDPVVVDSKYSAIVNNTDQEVYIEADTGDYHVLGSKQAIGVHKSAYSSLTYYFEGAGIHPVDEDTDTELSTTEIEE